MPRFHWPALAVDSRWRPPVPGWRRRGQWGGVLLGVLLVHAWLIGPLRPPLGRAPERAPAMQVVVLTPPPDTAEPAAEVPPPPAPGPGPVEATEPAEPPPLLAAPEPAPSTEPPRPSDDRPVDWTAGPRPPELVSGTEEAPASAAADEPAGAAPVLVAEATASRASEVAAGASELGRPPPVYQTQPPTRSFRLEYRVERGEARGIGLFRVDLQEDGQYRAELQAEDGERMVMDWVSRGRFDTAGVAPERMVERQRGKDARAVNFQRDKGVISYSGTSRALALQPGAQDRASLLLQLMAIARAQPGGLQAGQELRLLVANARSQAGEWRFEVAGEEPIEHRGARLASVKLVREPSQPYDQRVEVWLAREAGYLPVGLRLTTLPGREPVSLWLAGPLPPVDGAAPRAP